MGFFMDFSQLLVQREQLYRYRTSSSCLRNPHGIGSLIFWHPDRLACSRRALCMGVVKVDSCEPDWDWRKMMEDGKVKSWNVQP